MKKESEKLLERKLREAVKAAGGLSLKFTSPGFTGVPDRLNLLPAGKAVFAEIKTTGKPLQPRQQYVKALLEGLGFEVFVIDSLETLNLFLDAIS